MDREILNLRAEGKSLREIASILGISHVAVLKRVKNAHVSRVSGELEKTGNQVVTEKTPCSDMDLSKTAPSDPFRGPCGGLKEDTFEDFDLVEAIKKFLEAKGLKLERLKVETEAYQLKHSGQVVRFYIQREKQQKAGSFSAL